MRGKSVSEVVVVEMIEKNKSKARRIKKLPDEKDQTRAAELLAKRYGLFKEKALVEGDVNLTIEVDYGDDQATEQ
jgi:possible terminase small subunit